MSTLFKALISQHSRTLKPMRYAETMTAQLQNFFEEVVLENSLSALVVESLPPRAIRTMREIERVRRIGEVASQAFFLVSANDELRNSIAAKVSGDERRTHFLPAGSAADSVNERFVVIADEHFSALLIAVTTSVKDAGIDHQVIYSFDPDVVYTALEYLGARFAAEHPAHAGIFMDAVHRSMPKATSLPLTLAVTTKLANLWQEQTGREIAVNRIATAIRQSLELDEVLQTAVNEVGLALGVKRCALLVESEESDELSTVYLHSETPEDDGATIRSDLEAYKSRLRNHQQTYLRDGFSGASPDGWHENPQIVVPLSFLGQFVGVFFVQGDSPKRAWQESEVLLLETVADQVAIAIKHARLYVKSQQEALRDALTGIFNRRFFEMQFEREFKLAQRKNTTFALLMLDIDKFKLVNDAYGHATGDKVLRHTANLLRGALRAFDTAARYGGEEFVVILPQVTEDEAAHIAERLRLDVESMSVPDAPKVTASFGVACYPANGENMSDLIKAADKALYRAKRDGRNQVCAATGENFSERINNNAPSGTPATAML